MKFILITTVALLISLFAISQVQFNIFAGPQGTAARYTISDVKQKTEMKIGFQAGAGLKVPFENKLYFAPTAFYSMKGYKVTYSLFNALPDIDAKGNNTTFHTFELAFLLQYDFNTSPGHFFIKAGPSLDFQLLGTEKFNLKAGGSVDRKIKFSYSDYARATISASCWWNFAFSTEWMMPAFLSSLDNNSLVSTETVPTRMGRP